MRLSTLVNLLIVPVLAACSSVKGMPTITSSATYIPPAFTLESTIAPTPTNEQRFLAEYDNLVSPYALSSENNQPNLNFAELKIPESEWSIYVQTYVNQVSFMERLAWGYDNYDLATNKCKANEYAVLNSRRGAPCETASGPLKTHVSPEQDAIYLEFGSPEDNKSAIRDLWRTLNSEMKEMEPSVITILKEMLHKEFSNEFGTAPDPKIIFLNEEYLFVDLIRDSDSSQLRRLTISASNYRRLEPELGNLMKPGYSLTYRGVGAITGKSQEAPIYIMSNQSGDLALLLFKFSHEYAHKLLFYNDQNLTDNFMINEDFNEAVPDTIANEMTMKMLHKYFNDYRNPTFIYYDDLDVLYTVEGDVKRGNIDSEEVKMIFKRDSTPEISLALYRLRQCSSSIDDFVKKLNGIYDLETLKEAYPGCYSGN